MRDEKSRIIRRTSSVTTRCAAKSNYIHDRMNQSMGMIGGEPYTYLVTDESNDNVGIRLSLELLDPCLGTFKCVLMSMNKQIRSCINGFWGSGHAPYRIGDIVHDNRRLRPAIVHRGKTVVPLLTRRVPNLDIWTHVSGCTLTYDTRFTSNLTVTSSIQTVCVKKAAVASFRHCREYAVVSYMITPDTCPTSNRTLLVLMKLSLDESNDKRWLSHRWFPQKHELELKQFRPRCRRCCHDKRDLSDPLWYLCAWSCRCTYRCTCRCRGVHPLRLCPLEKVKWWIRECEFRTKTFSRRADGSLKITVFRQIH